jgi:hypothetical protein
MPIYRAFDFSGGALPVFLVYPLFSSLNATMPVEVLDMI